MPSAALWFTACWPVGTPADAPNTRMPQGPSWPPGWPARMRCRPRRSWLKCSKECRMPDVDLLIEARIRRPGAIARAAAERRRPASLFGDHGKLMIIAADHPARGALHVGADPMAMGNRAGLLDRICTALARPGVNGVLGTPDILEDLLLLGVLDDKVVIGSMNRGGLAGTSFEIDDRFTAYDADSIAGSGFEGGKMLLRIDPADAGTASTLESCAKAVSGLA